MLYRPIRLKVSIRIKEHLKSSEKMGFLRLTENTLYVFRNLLRKTIFSILILMSNFYIFVINLLEALDGHNARKINIGNYVNEQINFDCFKI